MTFLVLLLALGAHRGLGWYFKASHDRWFSWWRELFAQREGKWPRLTLLVILLGPLAVAGLVLEGLEDGLFGFVGLILQAVILLYALGRENLSEVLRSYLSHWRQGNTQTAYHHACRHYRLETGLEAVSADSLHRSVFKGLGYQWFEQVFVVVFWFLLAGPLAALLMRLLSLYPANEKQAGILQLRHALEWLPARLLGLTFAVAGNFTHCFQIWKRLSGRWLMPTEELLYSTSLGALSLSEAHLSGAGHEDKQARQLETLERLLERSLVIWVMVAAVLVLV